MALRMKHHLGHAVPQLGFEPVPMRLRAYRNGELALDTQHGVLVWEPAGFLSMFRAVPGLPNTWEPHASIRARSHPWGRKPSIMDPAKVVSRFMGVVRTP